MGDVIRIGMDTSKSVFQLHGVDASEEVVFRKKLSRRAMISFFSKLAPVEIGIEACGGSHHWARFLGSFGHDVKLLPAQYVKAYVKRGKNDARDAEALCEAMSRPTMRFVPAKTVDAQAGLMLVGVRSRLLRARTQLANSIRGHAAEFGHTARQGLSHVTQLLSRLCEDAGVPALARRLFADLGEELADLNGRIDVIEAELKAWHRADERSQRLAKIRGLGPVGAMMLSLKAPDPHGFGSGRAFAAWLGLTPKDHSTAGKTRSGVITRAGDAALRAVLVAGATAVIRQVQRGAGRPWPWLEALLARKAPKLVAVALANKLARIAWRLMVGGGTYDPGKALAGGAEKMA
ncbi:MAG: IS110 family transposase [Pseudomonadota bacterium]